jgi:hypothetical protein
MARTRASNPPADPNDPTAPAFPCAPNVVEKGLSRREYFASMALCSTAHPTQPDMAADLAVQMADALIARLAQ